MAKKNYFRQKLKKSKTSLVFDSEERKTFLTGFQKRKAERRLKAKEILDKELKEEKLRIKQRQRERLNELYENQRTVPEVQHLLDEPTITYDLPQQLVNITTFDAKSFSGNLGLSLGVNQSDNNCENDEQNSDNNSGQDSDQRESNARNLPKKIIEVRKSLRKQRIASIKNSKAFQTQQKLKHKKDVTKAKIRKKQLKKEMSKMKGKAVDKMMQKKKRQKNKSKKFTKH